MPRTPVVAHPAHVGRFRVFAVAMLGLAFVASTTPAHAQSATPTAATYVTNGAVRTSAVGSDGKMYIGGDFTYVGPNNGNGMPVSTSDATVDANFPKVNGTIYTIVPGAADEWYIGGSFTKVGGVTRNNIAKVTKSGSTYSVASWDPNANGAVYALSYHAYYRTLLYVGGAFTSISGQTRNRIASYTASDGALTSWDPNANDTVYTLMNAADLTPTSSYYLYIGGAFTTIGGATRNRAASYCIDGPSLGANCGESSSATTDDSAPDALRTWHPDLNGTVYTIVKRTSNYNFVYLGGAFTTYGGASQNRAARAAVETGTKSTWDVNVGDGAVYTIDATTSSNVYLGGTFTTVNSTTRNRLADVSSLSAGSLNTWNPNANGAVYSLKLSGSTMYVGGAFTSIGATAVTRNYLAAVSTSDGEETSWNPLIGNEGSNDVRALSLGGTSLLTGGTFSSIGGKARNYLAKLGTDGVVDSDWDPNANGVVRSLAVDSTSNTTALYVGGDFTTVGGTTRNRLAKVGSSSTGSLDGTWDPNAGGAVNAVAVSGSTIYAGGAFTAVNGGTTRNRLAALNDSNGTASAWDPNMGGTVNAIAVNGSDIYVGGAFTTANGGTTRNRLAAFTTASATASSWDPNAGGTVHALAVSGSTVYAGGAFTTMSGSTRNYAAAIGTNGTLGSWDPNGGSGTNGVTALLLNSGGTTAYLGGDFTSMSGSTRNRVAAISTTGSGTLKSWDPNMGAAVLSFIRSGSVVFAGGSFTTVGGIAQGYFAQFDPPTVTLSISGSPAAEAGGVATVTATLSASTSDDVTVNLAFSGTATLTTDYLRSGTSITVTSGNTTGTATITAVQDALDEDDETIIMDIDTVTGATESGSQSVTATVTDDDAAPTIQLAAASSSGAESANATIAISLSTASGRSVSAFYYATAGTAIGWDMGINGYRDFSTNTSPCCGVTWNAGETGTKTVTVTIINDTIDEGDETFTMTLSSGSNATLGATTVLTYTITDDDAPPTVQFSAATSSGFEGTSPAQATVTLSAASEQTVTVDYATANGTAASGSDYTAASGTLTFTAGQTSKTADVTIANDTLNEANETFTIAISNPSNATLGATTTHTYTINDDDGSPVIGFSANTSSGSEGTSPVTIGVALSVASGQNTTVDYAVTGGTATGGGVDYSLASGTATITAGATSTNITLTVANDSLNEANETIIVTLTNAVNAGLGTATHTYTITDNDAGGTVGFSSSASSGSEATTAVSLPISLSAAAGQNVTVNYAVTGGTATSGGADFTLANGTATVTAGATTTTIPLTIVNDSTAEPDETIIITLSSPVNATLGTSTYTYTITNDDDSTRPSPTSTGGPPDGQLYVPPDAVVNRTFSEALASGTVNTTNVTLRALSPNSQSGSPMGSNFCTSVTLSSGNTTITCAHSTLAMNQWYAFTIGIGVTDTSGNALATAATYKFQTSSFFGGTGGTNTTPPAIIQTFPTNGSVGIPTSTTISLTFSSGTEGNMKTGTTTTGSVQNPAHFSLFLLSSTGSPTGSNLCTGTTCALAWNATTRILSITPPTFTPGARYQFTAMGLQNTSNITMMGSYTTAFTIASASDTTPPTLVRTCGTLQSAACTVPAAGTTVSRFTPELSLTFSEALNTSTLTVGTTIGVYADADSSSTMNGAEALFDGNALSLLTSTTPGLVRMSNSSAFASATRYCFYVLGGASGVKDVGGNALATTSQDICFTTDAVTDDTNPKILFADADNYKLVAHFSEAVNATDVVDAANYTFECPVGVSIPLTGKTFTYRPEAKEVEIAGLGLQPDQSCRLTIAATLRDVSGNAFDTSSSNNVANFQVLSVATTGGFLGTSGIQTSTGFFGGMGDTAATFWEKPKRCAPRTTATSKSTSIECEFPAPVALTTGATLTLSFPSGFTVTSAAAPSATASATNNDVNGFGPGTTTISSVTANGGTVTVALAHAGTAMASGDMLRFELSGITTPSTGGTDLRIAIVVKDASGVKVGQTVQPAPFSIQQGGQLSIVGRVCKGSASGGTCGSSDTAISGVKVTCDQMGGFGSTAGYVGHQEATTDASGNWSITGLPPGAYGCNLPPQDAIFSANISGTAPFRNIPLSASLACAAGSRSDCVDFKFQSLSVTNGSGTGANLSVSITGAASLAATQLDVFCSAIGDFQSSAPTMKVITLDGSGNASGQTLVLQNGKRYQCGVGPHIAFEAFATGGPPPIPTFLFMPPKPQTITAGTDTTLTFTLTTTNRTIAGTVVDGSGTGIANAFVHAAPVNCFDAATGQTKTCNGGFAQSKSDGTFSISVSDGTYTVAADGAGLPRSSETTVTVNGTGATGVILKMAKASTTISGQVFDESGSGIKYAHVGAEKITSGGTCATATPVGGHADSPTDSSGNYTLYVSDGTWCVRAFAPAYGEVTNATVTVAGSSQSGQNLQATASNYGTIAGTVTKAGTAVSGAFINCFSQTVGGGNNAQTSADGTYSVKVKAGAGYQCDGFIPGVGSLPRATGQTVAASGTVTVNFSVENPGMINVTIAGITDAFCDARDANGTGNGTNAGTAAGLYTIYVPAGTYTVRCGGPKYGPLVERRGVVVTTGETVAVTGAAPVTRAVVGRVTDGTDNLAGATLAFTDTSGRSFTMQTGAQSGTANNVSAVVSDGEYTVIATKSGYAPVATTMTVSANSLTLRPIALTAATGTNGTSVSVTIQADGANYSGNARVIATTGTGASRKTVVAQVDTAVTTGANASLPLTNGTWTVKAVGDNGKESNGTNVTIANGVLSGSTPTLSLANTIAGFTAANESETLALSSGGLMKFEGLAVGGKAPEVKIPANVLSTTDSSTGKVEMKSDPTLKDVQTSASTNFVGSSGYEITPKDANGNAITSINGSVTVTIPYTDADVSAAGVDEANLQFASFNTTTQTWETFPTTVDTANNLLTATITHFSSFGIIGSIGSGGLIGRDATPPSAFRDEDLGAIATSSAVTLSWVDPQDLDLQRVDILRNMPPSIAMAPEPIGSAPTGEQEFVDTTVRPNTRYTYILRARDTSGNTRNSGEIIVQTPVAEAPATVGKVVAPPAKPPPVATKPTTIPGATSVAPAPPRVATPSPEKPSGRSGASPAARAPALIIPGTITAPLKLGSTGDAVRALQQFLKQDRDARYEWAITGTYGPVTALTVRRFQRAQQLPATGRVDATTLERIQARIENPAVATTITAPLTLGSTGDAVRALQQFLKQDRDARYEWAITGTYGPVTALTVRRFQRAHKLPATGRVDAKTLERIQASR
ncbi:peptidoglycan-binding protein [Candidatus Uhrbacteria bacterium]|nr:peptidoglycan-binding protein [Candidatus Uhrbacteria bacterium]